MSMFQGDPKWSNEKLLEAIKAEAVRGGQNGNLNYLMAAFTALLVNLSEQADRRARVLGHLTLALLFLTAVLV